MFVSSYSTYIQTNASDKITKNRDVAQNTGSSFNSKLLETQKSEERFSSNLPIDYVFKAKSFNNKLELKRQEEALKNPENPLVMKSKELTKDFSVTKTLLNAKTAYDDNSKIFQFSRRPHVALDQTPQTDTRLPREAQELQESHLRHAMVNAYAQNDRYYKVTAA